MTGIIVIGALAAMALIAAAAKPTADIYGMEDQPVAIENIRKGVQNGWYDCTLVYVNGKPAVRLSGRTADGRPYSDVFPITQEDWNTLKSEGYKV